MINQQLLDYIKKQQEAGTADEIINKNLAQAGWREEDIEEGFQAVSGDTDSNSTTSHQKIREEAVDKRASNDTYREEVKDEEAAGSQSSSDSEGGSTSLSPIEGGSKVDTTTDTESGGMKEISSEPTGDKTTGDSLNKITKKDTSQVDMDEVGPQAVRTFHSDSQRAGVDIKRSKPKTEQPKEKKAPDDINEAAAAVAAAEKRKEQARQDEEIQKETERQQGELEQKRRAEQAESAREQRKREEIQPQKREESHRSDEQIGNQAALSNPMADVSEPSRETVDGRRRFQAAAGAEQVKRRAARKQRQSESSGSNFVSILIFIVALVLVGGGAAWAYFTYFQTSTPEATADGVVESLAAAQTFDFRATIETAGSSDTSESRFVIEGAVDLNPDTPAVSYYTISQDGQLATPINAVMAEVENINTVPSAQRETINDVLLTPEFFTLGEFQTQERLGQTQGSEGFVTNRFSISMNPRQLVSDYATLHQALFDMPLSGAVLESLQASVAGFTPTQGQTWIDPDTGVTYQITFIGVNADGEDVQVNLQFKNHGQPLSTTPPYEPRSFEQTLNQYFSTVASEGEDERQNPPTSTSTETNSSTDSTLRFDHLRINDVQQLVVALRIYANKNDVFPSTLSDLTQGADAVLGSVPRDPGTNASYIYSVSSDGDRYHLGATLEVLQRSDLFDDANFNSRGQGFPGGFNGAVSSCGDETTTSTTSAASTCYDIAGLAE